MSLLDIILNETVLATITGLIGALYGVYAVKTINKIREEKKEGQYKPNLIIEDFQLDKINLSNTGHGVAFELQLALQDNEASENEVVSNYHLKRSDEKFSDLQFSIAPGEKNVTFVANLNTLQEDINLYLENRESAAEITPYVVFWDIHGGKHKIEIHEILVKSMADTE